MCVGYLPRNSATLIFKFHTPHCDDTIEDFSDSSNPIFFILAIGCMDYLHIQTDDSPVSLVAINHLAILENICLIFLSIDLVYDLFSLNFVERNPISEIIIPL